MSSANESSSIPVSLLSEAVGSLQAQCFDIVNNEMSFFYSALVNSLEKWFSANGWAGGGLPVKIPESIRTMVTRASGMVKKNKEIIKYH